MRSSIASAQATRGAVLLFHRRTTWANFRRDKMGTVMTALIHLTTRSRWNHAALALGDGEMVEANSVGVSITKIEWSLDDITIAYPSYYGNDREESIKFCTDRVGWSYGYVNAFMCGLRNLFPGIAHLKIQRNMICSELVAAALERAGHDFKKDAALVSPGDLAEHLGIPRK